MITLKGNIETIRVLKNLNFIILRLIDKGQLVQLVQKEPIRVLGDLKTTTEIGQLIKRESFISATVSYKESLEKVKNKIKEFKIESIDFLNQFEGNYPVDFNKKLTLNNYLNNQYYCLKNKKIKNIFCKRSLLKRDIRQLLDSKKFIEVDTPKIISVGTEGGSQLFEIKYYDKSAFLVQSPQLYKQMLMLGFNRVYELANVYRAENSNTSRHISEFTSLDLEFHIDNYQQLLETVISFFKELTFNFSKEKITIKVYKWYDLRDIALANNWDFDEKGDFSTRSLEKWFKDELFYIISEYPNWLKPFYIKKKNPDISYGFDLYHRGLEIASGGIREENYQTLEEEITNRGLEAQKFKFYTEVFKKGIGPHGGIGVGFERLLQVYLNIKTIKLLRIGPRDKKRSRP